MNVRYLAVVGCLILTTGCPKNGAPAADTTPKKSSDAVVPGTIGPFTAKQDLNVDLIPAATAVAGTTFSLSFNPDWMTVDPATGRVSGMPTSVGAITGVKVTKKSAEGEQVSTFDVSVVGDPLFGQQWAFENTGQKSYSKNAGLSGADIRVRGAHQFGALGAGINIMVSDEGVQIGKSNGQTVHEDFVGGVYEDKSKNYLIASPYLGDPVNPNPSQGNHGTSVAGIIGARGWNNKGVRGMAPESKIAGTNYLQSSGAMSIVVDQASNRPASGASYDVFNYSYGDPRGLLSPIDDVYLNQLIYGVSLHRNGKGSVYVKSAGNSYQFSYIGDDVNGNPVYSNKPLSANHEEENAVPWVFVIGAVNANGVRSSYSSVGANILVSAPGGEFGSNTPAIVTVDEETCDKGYSRTGATTNSFQTDAILNKGCNYTSTFNGTSSAAPHVTGTVALMMGANSRLTWREIRHVLATTATKIDAAQADVTGTIGATNFVQQDGWVTNAAGFHFSPFYGLGRVDTNAAVRAAAAFSGSLRPLKQTVTKSNSCVSEFCANDTWNFTSGTINLAVTDNNATGVQNTINVTSNFVIEAIQVRVNMTTVRNADIGLRLTSPSGTSGNILDPRSGMVDSNMVNQVFLSNRYYGESSQGNWTLKVFDSQTAAASTNTVGTGNNTLQSWAINVVGRDPGANLP